VLRGTRARGGPRRPADLDDQVVVADRVSAPYRAGLLALREGPILERAVSALVRLPDVLLVDGTGLDHPRRAGLAIHLGAVFDVPTVGVTHRPLVAVGDAPPSFRDRGESSPLQVDAETVGRWTCTKSGARPVVAHAAWRTDPDTASEVVLAVSTPAARTPVPLQEARRVAREARALGL
jgi:deoxyribonuclease V